MTTRTNEIKAEIAELQADINTASTHLALRERQVEVWTQYVAQLNKRLLQLEAQLEREDTVLMKPTGPCVTLTAHDGVKWDV